MYKGSGVHHVGIGVNNYELMKHFYHDTLGFTKVFTEFPEEEHDMSEVFRMPQVVFKGIMFQQEGGGVISELVRMKNPKPRPMRRESLYGDIGVSKQTFAVSDVRQFYGKMKGAIHFCSEPKSVRIPELGEYSFVYARDPEGNLFELASSAIFTASELVGGVPSIGVSVSDLERSKSFYQKYLGFDKILVAPHDCFSGLVEEISGTPNTRVKSCVLSNSKGGGMLELIQVSNPSGRSLPFFSFWGDFGYMEVALECDEIQAIGNYFHAEGLEVVARPTLIEEAEFQGWYLYLRDPDGIFVELVSSVTAK
jgi:catechol 2,3-dioxygenase-like lactoylglutathione lyase family enzyme